MSEYAPKNKQDAKAQTKPPKRENIHAGRTEEPGHTKAAEKTPIKPKGKK